MNAAYSTALSGLNADTTAIDTVGNDLANLNTTGYKATEIDFSDLMAEHLGGSATSNELGMGVGQLNLYSNYTQGSLQTTNGPTDAAIQGNGFFVVQNQNNQTLYTRDGSFQVNSSGQLTDGAGDLVQGWGATNGVVNTNSAIGNVSVPLGATIPATATTTMSVALNLDSTPSTTGTPATFSTPVQVIDSLGTSHTLTATFTNTGTGSWSYSLTIPSTDLSAGGTAPASVASGTLTFDSSGNLTSPAASTDPQAVSITGLADGAADMSIGWNLYNSAGTPGITQYAEASAVSGTQQNGFAAGQIGTVGLQNGGLLVANYSNGQQLTVGQLAVASIGNPNTLTQAGNNDLAASANTAAASIGAANTGSRGQVVAGALESSTVDIASEFTNLLTFERSYQANSRVITTSDQLVQDTLNLIHP
jgi:flagellar hook protein FlgE